MYIKDYPDEQHYHTRVFLLLFTGQIMLTELDFILVCVYFNSQRPNNIVLRECLGPALCTTRCTQCHVFVFLV